MSNIKETVGGDIKHGSVKCLIVFFILGLFVFASCGKKKKIETQAERPAPAPKATKTEEKKVVAKYVYGGYKNRNPFFMLGAVSQSVSFKEVYNADQQSSGFQLTGIMTDFAGTRYALLADSSGGSYILKKGWLYDAEGKRVPSVTGTVFENRIIIISGKNIKELKLPEEEPATKLE